MPGDTMPWIIIVLLGLTSVRGAVAVACRGRPETERWVRSLREGVEALLLACAVVFLVVRPFVLQAFYVPSGSMHPTLTEDDRILVSKLSYVLARPHRHDVVVFRAPREATAGDEAGGQEEDFVKRVIALPGDTVAVRDGALYVNGARQEERYTAGPTEYEYGPVTVPPDRLFVMGDNRNHSNDSHRWGTLEAGRVIGRAVAIFWPLERAGVIR